jgi:hypothetical protein
MHAPERSEGAERGDVWTSAAGTRRWLSPTIFALIGLCFLLPFATVSCDDATTSFTGIQLVTHTVPAGGRVYEASEGCSADLSDCVEQRGSRAARVVLFAALVGLVLAILGLERGPGWCGAAGLGGMFWLTGSAFTTWAEVTFRVGYWLIWSLLALAAVVHARRALRRRRMRRRKHRETRSLPTVAAPPSS